MNLTEFFRSAPECNDLWQKIGGGVIVSIAIILIYLHGKKYY